MSGSVLFRVSERLSNAEVRVRYREEVEYVDREIGRLLAAVEEESLAVSLACWVQVVPDRKNM